MLEQLVEDLKADEGFVPHAYQDTEGYWTIGYGSLIDSRKGGEIPQCIAEDWLRYVATRNWWAFVTRNTWVLECPVRIQRALGNMVYQMGVDGVCGFENMLESMEKGYFKDAALHALDSKWAREDTPNRANRIAEMIRG